MFAVYVARTRRVGALRACGGLTRAPRPVTKTYFLRGHNSPSPVRVHKALLLLSHELGANPLNRVRLPSGIGSLSIGTRHCRGPPVPGNVETAREVISSSRGTGECRQECSSQVGCPPDQHLQSWFGVVWHSEMVLIAMPVGATNTTARTIIDQPTANSLRQVRRSSTPLVSLYEQTIYSV